MIDTDTSDDGPINLGNPTGYTMLALAQQALACEGCGCPACGAVTLVTWLASCAGAWLVAGCSTIHWYCHRMQCAIAQVIMNLYTI